MASPAPSRLGPYEIVSSLGKGGMGEVWRARDPRLNREVAIKVSAQQFTDRFEREAHAIASLNHTNICTLFDIGPNYLVMELIEGPTLAERIAEGPIPVDEALAIAKQIADALEAAHEKGIVHRDLKPANIKIRPDGSVKVLDFGLAKSGADVPLSSDSPTMLSVAGMILGTAGYMAPEQARGKTVDKRADIWAFGVVLYEMVVGQRLFEGETVSDTLASVMKDDPDWTLAPARVQRLLRRCLEKDPQKRLRDISGVELLLEPEHSSIAPSQSRLGMTGRFGLAGWIAAGCFLIATATLAFILVREKAAETPVVRFNFGLPEKAAFVLSAGGGAITLSPNGRRVAFVARSADGKTTLWVRAMDTLTAQPIAGTEGAIYPFWSPDSRFIAFSADGKLKKIDVSGGPALTLADAPALRGGSWSRDDVILFAPDRGVPLQKVAAAGGASSQVTRLDTTKGETSHRGPAFLPDGRHFLFASPTIFGGDHVTIRLGSLDSPDSKSLFEADSNAVYAAGHLLFLRESTLMAQPFDLSRLVVAGEAVPLAEHVQHLVTSAFGLFSASDNGALVYAAGEQSVLTLTWFDRSGKRLSNVADPALFGRLHLSPDRKSAAVSVTDHNNIDIWIYDLIRGLGSRFTFDPALEQEAIWSPDGRAIVFSSSRKGHDDLYRKASDGTGAEALLYADNLIKTPTSWSPDGKFLLYTSAGAKTGYDIWTLPLTPEHDGAALKPYPWLQTPFLETSAQFSPDGRWVSYQSNETGRSEIYVAPFQGAGGKRQVSTAGGVQSRWRPDGKELFYIGPDQKLTAVDISTKGAVVDIGAPHPLFGPVLSGRGYNYDVSADGQRFLVEAAPEQSASQELTVVQNWTAGLKK